MNEIYDCCFDHQREDKPIIVAPAMTITESQNALAITYAEWLGREMGWPVAVSIFQAKTMSKDFEKNGWFRLVNESEFYGSVEPGRRYIIADDVCTMGGTLASLRGFIESQGAKVICTTALASRDGSHALISLAAHTLSRLTGAHGGLLAPLCQTELGYEVSCLTQAEGQFLLRWPSLDDVRAGIYGARDS